MNQYVQTRVVLECVSDQVRFVRIQCRRRSVREVHALCLKLPAATEGELRIDRLAAARRKYAQAEFGRAW